MTCKSMAASHVAGKGKADASFSASAACSAAIAKYGKDKVVDATIGVINDENGDFATFKTVEDVYRNLPAAELMNYAPIPGLPDFRNGAINFVFQGHQPKGTKTGAIASMGGTGSIYLALNNYVGKGEKFFIPKWCWGPYIEMGTELEKEATLYEMFDENGNFTLDNLKAQITEALKTQDNILTIFNTPAHNPSGYTMTDEDWKGVTDFYRECAKDESKKMIVLWDMAYTEYAGTPDETRSFLKNFDDMPGNMMLLVAFSLSKTLLIYGMRAGALVAASTQDDVIEEFERVVSFTTRAAYSNGGRGAQKMFATIVGDPALKAKVDAEREEYRKMIANRAKIFLDEAKEVGLKPLPYKAGFFVEIPVNDPPAVQQELAKRNIFIICFGPGIRFCLSAVPTDKVPGLAKAAKECIDIVDKK